MENEQAQYEIKKYEQLKNEKATVQNRLNQIAHYIFPRKYNIDTNGEQTTADLPTDVYDGTGVYSLKVLSSGLASFLTNPSSKWFRFTTDEEVSGVSKLWLQSAQKAVYRLFSESNFYQAMSEAYKTIGAFGTGILYSEDDPKTGKFYQTFDIMNCVLETDGKGRVVGVYRDYYYTALQCVEEFGEENVPKVVLDALKSKSDTKKFNILHVVRPRRKYEEGKIDKLNKPISSAYYLVQTKDLLRESGFDKFPYKVARFETNPNEPYGYGPAEDALPDIKSLNQAVYDWHESVQFANKPVVIFPSDSYGAPSDLAPGDVIYKQGGDPSEKVDTINSSNPNIMLDMLKDMRDRIRQAFFVDLFLAITNETKRMTIPELQERVAEKMNILGSGLHSLTTELLKPVVMDALDSVVKRGVIDEAPQELSDLSIKFTGPLARAQRNLDATAIQQWIGSLQGMAQTPELVDALLAVDAVNSAIDLADILGVPVENVRDKEAVMQIKEAQANARQEMAEQQAAAQNAAIAESASKAHSNMKR